MTREESLERRPRPGGAAGALLAVAAASVISAADAPPVPQNARTTEGSATAAAAAAEKPPGVVAARSTIQGAASLERRKPVAGATVLVAREGDAGDLWVTSTDEKGTFRLGGLPDGSYVVEFRRPGLETLRKQAVVLHAPYRSIVEVTMKPGVAAAIRSGDGAALRENERFTFEGRIGDAAGAPVADARLRLVRADSADDPRAAVTATDGSFRVEGILPGRWEIDALGLGYLPVRFAVALAPATRLHLVLVRQPATYRPLPLDLVPAEEPIPPPA